MTDIHRELEHTVTASPDAGLIVDTRAASLAPVAYPLTIAAGATWNLYVTWRNAPNQPVDLSSGYTAAFTIYDEPGGTALVSLIQGAGITLAASTPTITITRTGAQTALYTWGPRAWYVLTVTLTSGSVTTWLLHGTIEVLG